MSDLIGNLQAAVDSMAVHVNQQVERALVQAIEVLLGRVPSNDEVRRHAQCIVRGDELTYLWDDTWLLSWRSYVDDKRWKVEIKTRRSDEPLNEETLT